jgi:hypothetical protein
MQKPDVADLSATIGALTGTIEATGIIEVFTRRVNDKSP